MLLKEPDYVPAQYVDNTAYDAANTDRFTVNGTTLKMVDKNQVIHYHTNMAAMIQIGKWLDYLKEQGVYDNTRIIIVADHGRPLEQIDELILGYDIGIMRDVEFFYPLLMVKDLDARGSEASEEFMTNADVPTLAVEGLIDNPTNPFTGNMIDNHEKTAHEQYVILSEEFSVSAHGPNTFNPARWYSVKDNIWDKENWTYIDEITTVPSGAR
jgi:membrane-anchored protein YejM (alkaline phosphatase superfamily)